MKKYFLSVVLLFPFLFAYAQPVPTFSPVNGATGVSLSNNLTVTFDVAIRAIDDSNFNNTSIDGVVSLMNGATPVAFDASISGGDKIITIDPTSNLSEETTYTLTISSVENSSNAATGTLQITFTTGDFTNPTLTFAHIINNQGTSLTFEAQADDQGTVYWVITTDNTQPTIAKIFAGEDDNGPVGAGRFGNFAITANAPGSVNITGLSAATKYRVYFFIRDEGGNDLAATNRTEPVRSSSSTNSITASSITLRVNFDMEGDNAALGSLPQSGVYYVATLSSTKPTAAQILAGQDNLGATAPASGRFDITSGNIGSNVDHAINSLDDGTQYYIHFLEVNDSKSFSEIHTESATTLDNTPPAVTTLVPAQGSAEVDISTTTFTMTFDENVDDRTDPVADDTDRIRLMENGVQVESIGRGDGTIDANGRIVGTGNTTITIEFVYVLKPNMPYQILIGEDVIEDMASNDFDTSPSNTDPFAWSFTTSGVTANNLTSSLCSGSFQSVSDIVITENGVDDINNSGTIELELANTADFAFQTSGVSASETGNDISITSVTSTFSKITLTYTRSGGTTKDVITITGIKVYATGSSPSTTVRRTGGTANIDGGNGLAGSSITYASINSGASAPAAPTLAAAQDLIYCVGENLSTASISLNAQPGATFNWYNNSGLTGSPVYSSTSTSANLATNLGMTTPAVAGTSNFYVVAVTGCQSASSLAVSIQVYANPTVNAGADPAAICFGSSVQIGGSPTLVSTSIPGAHTYSWATPGGSISDATNPNPTVTPPAPAGTTQNFDYTVTVTAPAPYGCFGQDVVTVQVKSTAQSVTFAQPSQFSYTVSDNPINLAGTPPGGSFSGIGVIQVGATAYEFDPEQAGLGTHTVTYTTTLTNGCTKSTSQNFFVSNTVNVFPALSAQHCSNEGQISLAFTDQLAQQVKAYVNNWNTNWTVQYGYAPIKFTGLVRNYYNGNQSYGWGDNGNITDSGFDFLADGIYYPRYQLNSAITGYPGCTGCNFSYIQVYIEFVNPLSTYPYDIPVGTNYGYQFNDGVTAGFTYGNAESTRINQVPTVFFSGLVGLPGSPPLNQRFCNSSTTYNLTGNFEGGTFEISRNNSTFYSGVTLSEYGIFNDGANPGEATFNPQLAFNSNNFAGFTGGGNAPIQFYIRYTYDPGTDGGSGQACSGQQTRVITIYPLPDVNFATNPVNNQQFCYDDANVALSASGSAGATFSFLGYGITNISSGNASFDPDAAFEAKEFDDNATHTTAQTMVITARATSAVGCINETTRNLIVRALPPATFTTPPRLVYCYEDVPFNITGAQSNTQFSLVNLSTTSPPNFTQDYLATNVLAFNAKNQFDAGVTNGADPNSQQDFQLTYTVDDNSGLGCTNSTVINLTINPALVLDIVGTDPGITFCENGTQVNLSGNFPGAGKFSTSVAGTVFAETGNGLINGNLPTGNGLATLNLLQAYDAVNDTDDGPPGPVEPFYVRYTYRGPTCTGDAVYTDQVQITSPPVFAFTPPTPADNAAFCYDQSPSPAAVTIQTNTPANTTLTLSGTNTTFDPLTGTGSWNPTLAFKQREIDLNTTLNSDQTFVLTATSTDNTYGCVSTISKPLVAKTLPPSSFNYANKLDYCYEDPIQLLDGAELNASYKIVYNNTVPSNYAVTINQPDIQFDPDVYFEDAVTRGANRLATLTFDVVYTSTAGSGCTHRLDTVTFRVSPLIKGEIKGITNNDIFCSNGTDKVLEFTPSNGTFRVNNVITPVINDKYTFDPPIAGSLGGANYTFTYTVITGSNCTNTETKTVRVLPSPRALFNVNPRCDTALIAFNANASTNLSSSKYTWTLSDSVRSGTDLTSLNHRFPGVSTYSVNLRVDHPAYTLPDNSQLVCSDSLRLDQIVGPYPKIDFQFFNVCEEDQTDFDINSNIPISDVSWEFGDDPGTADRTPFGLLSANVPASYAPTTTGINERPRHRYAGAGNYVVTVYGRTAQSFGACVDTLTRTISILKKWAPSPTESYYSMEELDGGKGFWVVEDRSGNSTWEFASPTGEVIKSTAQAWTTDADGTYLPDDDSYVNSPCFDLSSFARPVISLDHWTDTPASDGTVLQYSTNGGQTWTTLGSYDLANAQSSGLEWYNTTLISSEPGGQQSGWSRGNQFDWAVGKHTLDVLPTPAATARKQVRFRIAFSSFTNKEGKDGFAFKNVKIEERNRTILVENFTNLTSTANNAAYRAFKALPGTYNFNTSELVKLQYHTPVVPDDELYADNPVDQSARAAFYGVTQPNKAYIDGGYDRTATLQSFNGTWLDTYFSLRSLVAAPLDIDVQLPSSPSDKFNVRATVTAINNVPAGRHHVFIAVAEKDVLGQLYVLRKLLPDASGTALTALTPSSAPQVIDASYDMRHVTRNSSGAFNPIVVIVFIQDLEGNKEILQTIVKDVPTPPSTIVTSIESLNSSFHVYPNPADNEMTIELPDNLTEGANLRIFDQVGKVVNTATFEKGQLRKTINTRAQASGVYLIQVESSKGILTRKVMVLHNQ